MMGSNGHEKEMEAVDLGGGLRTWHGTGRDKVLKTKLLQCSRPLLL